MDHIIRIQKNSQNLKIQIGFRSNLNMSNQLLKNKWSPLEIAREDHANIITSIE